MVSNQNRVTAQVQSIDQDGVVLVAFSESIKNESIQMN